MAAQNMACHQLIHLARLFERATLNQDSNGQYVSHRYACMVEVYTQRELYGLSCLFWGG